jgi:hypothetical protein
MAQEGAPASFSPSTAVDFQFVIGAFTVNSKTFLGIATAVATLSEFWNINYVTDFKLIQIRRVHRPTCGRIP